MGTISYCSVLLCGREVLLITKLYQSKEDAMTVIVSVKINDGIVMAADSVSSFDNGMNYQHANKIVNLKKGLYVGAMSRMQTASC